MLRTWHSLARVSPLLLAACGGGGGSGAGGDGADSDLDPTKVPDLGTSEFLVRPTFGTPADGVSAVTLELRLVNLHGRPIVGAQVMLEVSGCGNLLQGLPPTDSTGRAQGTLASFAGEPKTIVARTGSGGRETEFAPKTTEFLAIPERTYFVRKAGSDANSGRSPREAWGSLAQALLAAEPGATIHVGAGIHAGPLELVSRSASESPFVLSGDPSGRMTGDAGAVVIEAGGAPHALRVRDSRGVVLQDLTLRGGTAGLAIHASEDVRVFGCRVFENRHGLEIEGSSLVAVQDCRITRNQTSAARIGSVAGLRFENNLAYANLGDGLTLHDGIVDGLVRYNTFYRNAGPHVREAEPGGAGVITGNLFVEGSAESILLQVSSGYRTGVNLAWANRLPPPSREPPGTVEGDPRFVDPFGPDGILGGEGSVDDDFSLAPDSAAADVGIDLALAVVLPSHESLATRSTRTDGVLDGHGPDHPAANLGYHQRQPDPEYASVPKGGARFVHAGPSSVSLELRAWTREHPQRTDALAQRLLDGEVEFLEHRLSPLETREEILVAQVNTGQGGRILARRWDGRRFDPPQLSWFVDGIAAADLGQKRFDLEYEGLAGRALLAWADGDGIPSVSVLAHGRWSPARAVASTAVGAGRTRWVELVSRPGTDEMALVTLDDERDLVAYLWDGVDFGAPVRLEPNTLVRPTWRPFDAAFESLSGDLLVTWGFSLFAEETRWATLERASGQWRTGQHPSTDASGAQVVLAADPVSDRIVAAFGEGDIDNDVSVSAWTGSTWLHTAELTLAGPLDNRLLEAVWFGESGRAGVVFRRQGLQGSFNLAVLQPTGWRIQPDVILAGPMGSVGKAAKVVLRSVPGRAHLLGLVVDLEGRLFALHHNGQRFTLTDGGAPLATGLDPRSPGHSFDVALERAALRRIQ